MSLDTLYGLGFVGFCAFGYFVSLVLHPRVKCSLCKGKGSQRGWVFSYADRPCRRCRGTGRQERLGHRLFIRPPR